MTKIKNIILPVTICILIAASTFAVYFQIRSHDFINYDDPDYVYDNPYVASGLSMKSVIWAFTTGHASNWHPLTWLSHIIDCQLFGLNPGGHHLVSLAIHIINSVLLFLLFKRITAQLWPSAFIAFAFALHPMHIESVAWISERKDVLSCLFFILTLFAYSAYIRQKSILRYSLTLLMFAVGLTAKPMLVTLPIVMLILDYWPFERFAQKKTSSAFLILEKMPFFVLSAISSIITFIVQQQSGAVAKLEAIPIYARCVNAVAAYGVYVIKMFVPVNLAIYHPHPGPNIPAWQFCLAAAGLVVISIFAFKFRRDFKYIFAGWLFFIVTLVPVIGIIQVGNQAYANRYAYIPYIGLLIMIAFSGHLLFLNLRLNKYFITSAFVLSIAAMTTVTQYNLKFWKNNVTLLTHTVKVTTNNVVAHNNLGDALRLEKKYAQAIEHFEQAIALRPLDVQAYNNIGIAYSNLGDFEKAINFYQQAIQLDPTAAETYNNIAVVYLKQKKYDLALKYFKLAGYYDPDRPDVKSNLAYILISIPDASLRNYDQAYQLALEAVTLTNSKNPSCLCMLAAVYSAKENYQDALKTAQTALILAQSSGDSQLAAQIQKDIDLYQSYLAKDGSK
jgi:tetratricopeptide (TPR) repeat protein